MPDFEFTLGCDEQVRRLDFRTAHPERRHLTLLPPSEEGKALTFSGLDASDQAGNINSIMNFTLRSGMASLMS